MQDLVSRLEKEKYKTLYSLIFNAEQASMSSLAKQWGPAYIVTRVTRSQRQYTYILTAFIATSFIQLSDRR
jgi:transaldolase